MHQYFTQESPLPSRSDTRATLSSSQIPVTAASQSKVEDALQPGGRQTMLSRPSALAQEGPVPLVENSTADHDHPQQRRRRQQQQEREPQQSDRPHPTGRFASSTRVANEMTATAGVVPRLTRLDCEQLDSHGRAQKTAAGEMREAIAAFREEQRKRKVIEDPLESLEWKASVDRDGDSGSKHARATLSVRKKPLSAPSPGVVSSQEVLHRLVDYGESDIG